MKISHIICFLGLTIIVRTEKINNNVKKTFVFSGDANLDSPYSKDKINTINNKEDNTKNVEQVDTSSEKEIKDMISNINETIYKKNHLENLPVNEFSKEEEEEARENGSFLSNDLEEASQNFANSDFNDENDESETEQKDIKKYQAEVINAMNHSGIYQKIDKTEIDSINNIMNDNNEYNNNNIDECYHDYSLICPLDFFRTSTGCIPMKSYKGPCQKIQNKLIYLKDEQKKSWEEICETNWPCISKKCEGGSDYSINCPIGYIEIINNKNNKNIICKKEYGYNKCGNELNIINNEIYKIEIEKKCNIRWKCKSPIYFENYNFDCPMNWTLISSNKCKASNNYKGDCPNIINLKNYKTEEKKKQIEIACLVNWPYEVHYQKYQRNYNVCPIGWTLLDNNLCKSPENYKSNDICKDIVSFHNMTNLEKQSYSTKCYIDFPFKDKEDCKKDYTYECPLEWILINQKGYCKAPLHYKSKICKNISKFNKLTENHIEFYKKSCNIEWPCEGEIQNSKIYLNEPINIINENKRNIRSGAIDSETGAIII